MDTKTKTRDEEAKPLVDKHKLAEKFKARLVINNKSIPDGEMDLSTMSPEGKVRNAPHNHTPQELISGEVLSITLPNGKESFLITLTTTDKSATYTGVLLHDTGTGAEKELAIGGFFRFDQSIRRRDALADPAQNEGVWIITKP